MCIVVLIESRVPFELFASVPLPCSEALAVTPDVMPTVAAPTLPAICGPEAGGAFAAAPLFELF